MHLSVLAVPGCPNASVLTGRLAVVLDGLAGISVSGEVTSPQEAARRGMRGSPALLTGGADPFAGPGQAPGMSCRLYRDDSGRVPGAPSVSQLRHVIGQALAGTAGSAGPA
jgi:hypothetical protein